MDDLDRAKDLEMRQREVALQRVLNRPPPPPQLTDDDGRVLCLDCGEPIPEARLQARPDAVRCVECKQIHEQLGR